MRSGVPRPMRTPKPTGSARLIAAALALVAVFVLLGATAPQPSAFVPSTDFVPSPEGPAGGASGGNLLGLLLLAALALVAVVAGAAAAVILYRTRGSRATHAPEDGWWTCQSCGAGNIDGAARCHACSTWRTSVPRPTTSA